MLSKQNVASAMVALLAAAAEYELFALVVETLYGPTGYYPAVLSLPYALALILSVAALMWLLLHRRTMRTLRIVGAISFVLFVGPLWFLKWSLGVSILFMLGL